MLASLLRDSLGRVQRHVDATRVALTGSVAIELQLGAPATRQAHDIDLVAATPDAVRPTLTDDFLVSHFHLPQAGYSKFLIQLVDPHTRLRIDVFPDALGTLTRARHLDKTLAFPVLDAADILDHKLATLAKSSPTRPDDPKHYHDAVSLAAHLDCSIPAIPASHLRPAAFSRDINGICDRCRTSATSSFPLADKRAILSLLGYV